MSFIEIERIKNPKRRNGSQRGILKGLRLNRIGCARLIQNTPSNRGMLKKVSHLVEINNDPVPPYRPRISNEYDEAADIALMQRLAFDGRGVVLEPYPDAALKHGKCPDFKILKDGKLVGFCEVKSPRDDFAFGPVSEKQVEIRKGLPYYRKLGSLIKRAALQFDAHNANHEQINIMVFVNHAPDLARRDLHATISGLPAPEPGKRIFMLGRVMQEQVLTAARRIDLFLWIDAEKGTCQHVSVNDAPHQAAALELLGLKND